MFGILIASLSYQKDYRKDNLNATGKNDTSEVLANDHLLSGFKKISEG
jgi:hypothetical protein